MDFFGLLLSFFLSVVAPSAAPTCGPAMGGAPMSGTTCVQAADVGGMPAGSTVIQASDVGGMPAGK